MKLGLHVLCSRKKPAMAHVNRGISAGDFPRAWEVLLDHIKSAALSKNNEVSLAALKSFQEILQIIMPVKDWERPDALNAMGMPALTDPAHRPCAGPLLEQPEQQNGTEPTLGHVPADELEESVLWWAAWSSWRCIGMESTQASAPDQQLAFVPSQPFLTTLVQIFLALYQHIKTSFSIEDLRNLGAVLQRAVAMPIGNDSSPFILPSYTEVVLTSLQEAVLTALDVLQKVRRLPSSRGISVVILISLCFPAFNDNYLVSNQDEMYGADFCVCVCAVFLSV